MIQTEDSKLYLNAFNLLLSIYLLSVFWRSTDEYWHWSVVASFYCSVLILPYLHSIFCTFAFLCFHLSFIPFHFSSWLCVLFFLLLIFFLSLIFLKCFFHLKCFVHLPDPMFSAFVLIKSLFCLLASDTFVLIKTVFVY